MFDDEFNWCFINQLLCRYLPKKKNKQTKFPCLKPDSGAIWVFLLRAPSSKQANSIHCQASITS